MSTLPAASSLSGSAVSEGTTGCTSRPTARKSPRRDGRVERGVVGVGEPVEHHREGLGRAALEITSCFEPQRRQRKRARERERRARQLRDAARRSTRAPRRIGCAHGASAALGERERVEAGDGEGEQQHRGSVGARRL